MLLEIPKIRLWYVYVLCIAAQKLAVLTMQRMTAVFSKFFVHNNWHIRTALTGADTMISDAMLKTKQEVNFERNAAN